MKTIYPLIIQIIILFLLVMNINWQNYEFKNKYTRQN